MGMMLVRRRINRVEKPVEKREVKAEPEAKATKPKKKEK